MPIVMLRPTVDTSTTPPPPPPPPPPPGFPVADFLGSPLSGTAPLAELLLNLTTGTPTPTYYWEYATTPGVYVPFSVPTSQDQNVTLSANTYSIRLTATNTVGVDQEEKLNYISVSPVGPPPPPPPPPAGFGGRVVVGGWRIRNSFSTGVFTADWATNRMWMVGRFQGVGQNQVYRFTLPAPGTGNNPDTWPEVTVVQEAIAANRGGYGR